MSTTVAALLSDGSSLFAGTNNGVFRSVDGGSHWSPTATQPTTADVRSLLKVGGTLLAGTYGGGVFRSSDGGVTWTAATTQPQSNQSILTIAAHDTTLLLGNYGGVYRSFDAGANWVAAETQPMDYGSTASIFSLAIGRASAVAGTYEEGIFYSNDGGRTWAAAETTYATIHAVLAADSIFLAGTTGVGALRSTDGGKTWTLPASQPRIYVSTFATGGSRILAGAYNVSSSPDESVFVSADGGINWSPLSGLTGKSVASLIAIGGTVLAGTTDGVWVRAL